jgi:mannose-1-phosphate guanylyltransferase
MIFLRRFMKLIPTMLCGGTGSRLWPVSRELHLKSFVHLADGQSLLQKAWLPDATGTLSITDRELFFSTEDEYLGEDDIVRFEDVYGRQ